MLKSITSHIPSFSSVKKADNVDVGETTGGTAGVGQEETAATAMTDPQGRTLGLEDPMNPALIDDPAIFQSNIPTVAASSIPPGQISKTLVNSAGQPYINPKIYGGSNLDSSAGLGEPLNVIVSALSSPAVLTSKGLLNYVRSLSLDFECLGLHSGAPQQAWLDPRGWFNQQFEYREVYTPLDHIFGTCIESLAGGNHVRGWQQAGTGAWFFATSKEQNVTKQHDIVPNGYDVGRDWIVGQIEASPTGETSFMFKDYQTKVEYITGLIAPGTAGINHDISTDGKVALLTVKLLTSNDKAVLATRRKESKAAAKSAKVGSTPNKKRFSLPVLPKKRVAAT